MRRLLAWLVVLPLTAAGTFLTHSLLPTPAHAGGQHVPSATDTGVVGFLCSLPFLLSTVGLLALLVVIRIVQTAKRRSGPSVSAWPFAFLVPLGFLLHHHFEHFLGGAPPPLEALVGAELLVGFVLQLPFALLAYLLATALLRVADRLVAALAARRRRAVCPPLRVPPRRLVAPPRIALLATAAAPRAPPLAA